jgi:hypothetical protein
MKLSGMLRSYEPFLQEHHSIFLQDANLWDHETLVDGARYFACALGKIAYVTFDGDIEAYRTARNAWGDANNEVWPSYCDHMLAVHPELAREDFVIPEGFPLRHPGDRTLADYIDTIHSCHRDTVDWLQVAELLEANGL